MKNLIGGGRTLPKLIKRVNVSILAFVLLCAFCIGGLTSDMGYAAVGALDTPNGYWYGDATSGIADGDAITVGYAGEYVITVKGGNSGNAKGGHISGVASLKVGDKLQVKVYNGGSGGYSIAESGGKAVLILLNGTPLVGAGGAGGGGRNKTIGMTGQVTEGSSPGNPVVKLQNNTFSAGGGGSFYLYSGGASNYGGGAGATYTGLTSAAGGSGGGAGTAGTNYLDTSRINFLEAPNDSTAIGYTVQYRKLSEEDIPAIQQDIADNLLKINETIKSSMLDVNASIGNMNANIELMASTGGGSNEVPMITVVKGKAFSVGVGFYDDMQSGTADSITVTNATIGDGIVVVSGTLNTVGIYTAKVNGKKFGFNVVEEPDSSNVLVLLQ